MIIKCDMIIAVDPGISNGGIADYRDNRVDAVHAPAEAQDILKRFQYLSEISENPLGIIEKVGHFVGEGSAKKFGIDKLARHAERLKSAFTFLNIPYVQVAALEWQKVLSLRMSQEDGIDYVKYKLLKKHPVLNAHELQKYDYEIKKARKNRYKAAAQIYYPQMKATNWNCDALLLIELMRRKLQFDPQWILDKLPKEAQGQLTIY